MHRDHKIFIKAIQDKKKVIIQHRNKQGHDIRTKVYRPLFYIPANNRDSSSQYYFWEGVSGPKGSIVKLEPEKIMRIGPTQESFESTGFRLTNDDELPDKDSRPLSSLENTQ